MSNPRINITRMMSHFDEVSQIGATGDGGVHRPALTEAHLAARAWLKEKIQIAGLTFSVDEAGNHFGRLECGPADAPSLLIGSHLDSVPHGGRFDGALGVVAGLEVLETVRNLSIQLSCNLEVVDFTDEEGTLIGLFGSRALSGLLKQTELERPRGGKEIVESAFRRAGIREPLLAARSADSLAGYLEMHIEQGPRLISVPADIGIVTALVGIGSFHITFFGRADHAGTTPMNARRDAGLGAAVFMVEAQRYVIENHPEAVINFGSSSFEPGAYNIVPERADLALEFRAASQEGLDELERNLLDIAVRVADTYGLELETTSQGCVPPALCSPFVRDAFKKACSELGLSHLDLLSGAGHDTQSMSAVCPAGMIFIPSTGGSHNPNEFAEVGDCENGANVLLGAVLEGWGEN